MERHGEIYVSATVREEVLKSLNLDKRHGGRPDIDTAVNFFRERIEKRYLTPINMLIADPFNYGFTIMAICCLLIDTFYQFEHGVAKSTNNQVNYTDFLRSKLGDVFDTQEKADRFYADIRCGILHSAQTQNGSRLSCDQNTVVIHIVDTYNSPISVDVVGLANRLEIYFNEYCNRIRYDNTTQSCFVKKLKKMF